MCGCPAFVRESNYFIFIFFFKEFNGILAYDAEGDLRIAGLLAVLIHNH